MATSCFNRTLLEAILILQGDSQITLAEEHKKAILADFAEKIQLLKEKDSIIEALKASHSELQTIFRKDADPQSVDETCDIAVLRALFPSSVADKAQELADCQQTVLILQKYLDNILTGTLTVNQLRALIPSPEQGPVN